MKLPLSKRTLLCTNIALLLLFLLALSFVYIKRIELIEAHHLLNEYEAEQVSLNTELIETKTNNRALIRHIVLADIDDYEKLTDVEKVTKLRDWTMTNLPLGESEFYDISFNRFFLKALDKKRGVLCGGSSYFLAHLLNCFEFEAVAVNFGVVETPATHVMTVVKLNYDENPSFLLLVDGFVGWEFVKENNKFVDFKKLMVSVRNGDIQDLKFRPATITGDKLILPGELYFFETGVLDLSDCKLESDYWSVNYAFFQRRLDEAMLDCIEAQGLPRTFFSLLNLPIGVGAENANLYNEMLLFYEQELGVTF